MRGKMEEALIYAFPFRFRYSSSSLCNSSSIFAPLLGSFPWLLAISVGLIGASSFRLSSFDAAATVLAWDLWSFPSRISHCLHRVYRGDHVRLPCLHWIDWFRYRSSEISGCVDQAHFAGLHQWDDRVLLTVIISFYTLGMDYTEVFDAILTLKDKLRIVWVLSGN